MPATDENNQRKRDFFYKPDNAWAADFIPFYENGEFHLFYLHDFRNTANFGEGTPWYKVTTKDFVHFTEHGEMIPRGRADEQDLYIFTGCVLKASDGLYHIFYTGHNPHYLAQGKPVQAIMHATSRDLLHWDKLPQDTFYAPADCYEMHDWRDPFVFWNEEREEYWMLLAARKKGARGTVLRAGCTAVCTSKDLITWQMDDPLWAPQLFHTHECPDLFRMGDWWYLIYSEYSDRNVTRYRMAKQLSGPWLMPRDDAFDGRAHYASKSACDGARRFLFGWNPTRLDDDDNKTWQWGGSLVVHEIFQREDGTLGSRMPRSIEEAFAPVDFPAIQGCTLRCTDGAQTQLLPVDPPETYKLDVDVRFAPGTRRCGVMIHTNQSSDSGYCYFLEPDASILRFCSFPNFPQSNMSGCERPIEASAGAVHHLTILVDKTIAVAYWDGQVALNARMYAQQSGQVGFVLNDGEAEFSNLVISTLK